jgi:hypothetical protein
LDRKIGLFAAARNIFLPAKKIIRINSTKKKKTSNLPKKINVKKIIKLRFYKLNIKKNSIKKNK